MILALQRLTTTPWQTATCAEKESTIQLMALHRAHNAQLESIWLKEASIPGTLQQLGVVICTIATTIQTIAKSAQQENMQASRGRHLALNAQLGNTKEAPDRHRALFALQERIPPTVGDQSAKVVQPEDIIPNLAVLH